MENQDFASPNVENEEIQHHNEETQHHVSSQASPYQELAPRRSTRDTRIPHWHDDFVMMCDSMELSIYLSQVYKFSWGS